MKNHLLKSLAFYILLSILFFLTSVSSIKAQLVYNNGASINFQKGVVVQINGSLQNQSGEIIVQEDQGVSSELIIISDFINNSIAGGNGFYRIAGNWENNNTFNAGTGVVFLDGSNQLITGTSSTFFNNLILDGFGIKSQTIDQYILGSLHLNHIELFTGEFKLFVENPDINAIQRTDGFISSSNNGYLSRQTNTTDSYIFPIGSSLGEQRYRPIEISPVNTENNTFTARMANVDATDEGFDRDLVDANIVGTNSLFYHQIDRTEGASSINLSVFYDDSEDGNWGSLANWTVAPDLWQHISNSEATIDNPLSFVTISEWNTFNQAPYILCNITTGQIIVNLETEDYNCGIHGSATITVIESCTGNPSISWSTGDIGLTVEGLEAGDYSVTISDDGCDDEILNFSIEETEDFSVNIVILDFDECDDTVTLFAEVEGADPDDVIFEWNNNPSYNNQTFIVSSSGTYSVRADYGFCRPEDEVSVTLYTTPTIQPVDNQSVCNSYTFPEIIGTNLTGNEAYYTQPDGNGESFEAGNTINFNTFNPENYPVTIYIYDAAGSCYDEESFELTIYQQPNLVVTDIYCDDLGSSYIVELAETPGNISSSDGIVDGFNVINISVGTDIVITVENYLCSAVLEVDAHNCSCDDFDLPVAENPVHQEICYGQENLPISVETPEPTEDYQINWYDVPSGGMPLLTDSETFTPSVTQPGVYTYYAEVQDIQSSCLGERIEVNFTIFDNPILTGTSIICEIGESTQLSVSGGSGTPHNLTPWESSNDAIATVDNGIVQAVSFGEVVITYMDSNGCTATRNISITDNCDNLFSISGKTMYAGRVHPHPVNGTQYDDPIYPIDSVMVVLKDINNNEVDSYFTGIDGEFTFTGVEPGDYTIEYYKVYNELSSWVNSINVTDYTWFKTYVLNHYDDYFSFLRFDDLYWYAMNVTCEQPPLWNVADYNQIKYKILNFSNYEVYEPFINNPNTFCFGAWQDGADQVTVTDHDITDHICLLIAYGDYNASAQGYVYRETGTSVHHWDENNKSNIENFISESNQTIYSDGKEVTIPMYINADYFNLSAVQLQLKYPNRDFTLKTIKLNDIYKNSTIMSKMNMEFEEFIASNHELVSTDYNGTINLIYSPNIFSNFNFITNEPVFYLTFESNNSNVNIESDLKLFGTSNILLNSKFQEFENVGFKIPRIVYSPANIEEHAFSEIKLYPNPARDFLNLEINLKNHKELQISVIDVTGRTVLTLDKINFYSGKNKITIPVSELSKGYYSIKVRNMEKLKDTHLNFIVQ